MIRARSALGSTPVPSIWTVPNPRAFWFPDNVNGCIGGWRVFHTPISRHHAYSGKLFSCGMKHLEERR